MITVFLWINVLVGLLLTAGTLLSLSSSPHWLIRGWDFPRVQIAVFGGLSVVLHLTLKSEREAWDWAYIALIGGVTLWQCYRIYPYTRLARNRVQRTTTPRADCTIKLLIANVQMENQQHHRFVDMVERCKPDVVLALEVDSDWQQHLSTLSGGFEHSIAQPQSNYYGMLLLSRLPLHDSRVRFNVQDDVPSIDTKVELPCGTLVRLYGLHPRPPEPIRNQDSKPRDAELVMIGKEIEKSKEPTIVAGDLNDVAWSPTSELFLRLSGLLDARMGRGLFNTWNANHMIMRFPLDHVFHSHDFRLVELQRMPHIGSDHFPVCAVLSYEPEATQQQPETAKQSGDDAKAEEKIEREQGA